MKRLFSIAVAAASLFASHSYAGGWYDEDCPSQHSLALCVSRAFAPSKEMRIQDVEVDKLPDAYLGTNRTIAKIETGVSAGVYLGANSLGMASLSAWKSVAGMGLAFGLADLLSPGDWAGKETRIFAWLPAEGTNSVEARVKFAQTVKDAYIKTFGLERIEDVKNENGETFYRVYSKECGTSSCYVGGSIKKSSKVLAPAKDDLAPDYLPPYLGMGNGEGYRVMLPGDAFIRSYICDEPPEYVANQCKGSKFLITPTREQLLALSANLPANVFIYLNPKPGTEDNFPLLLNQGRPLFYLVQKKS